MLVRVVCNKDGTKTSTIQYPESRTIETITTAADETVLSREKTQINASGKPVTSMVYDAHGALLSRIDHVYDQVGRKIGERTYNRKGRKVRDVVFTYDKNGKAGKPIVQVYADPDTPKTPTAPMAPLLTPEGRRAQPQPKN